MELNKCKEIRRELVNKNIANKKILKILVYERIKDVSKNNFKIQEIIFWSQRFNITEEDFILKVLMISYADYNKFLKNKNVNIKSDIYNTVKEKTIKKMKKAYMKNINMNIRNYYDRIRLSTDSLKIELNMIDFSIHILKKPRRLIKRVLKAKDSRTRFYIGKYINSKLSSKYFEKNIEYIQNILRVSLNKIITKLGLRIKKEDYEDKISEGIVFLRLYGNNLDKNNNEIINEENLELKKEHKRNFIVNPFIII
jgi:hypothetical protein